MHLDFCAVCGRRDSLEHHHFVPRSSGGGDDETNALTLWITESRPCRRSSLRLRGASCAARQIGGAQK